jgi:hypothetical protein
MAMFGEAVYPTFERLFEPSLLGRCTKGKTQNNNECLHSMIWSKCPKTNLFGLERVQACVALAVGEFNNGTKKTTEKTLATSGLLFGKFSKKISFTLDKDRLTKSNKRDEDRDSHSRQKRKQARLVEDQRLARAEGVTYQAGAFD